MNEADPLFESEWLETDGLGGYASSTVPGRNARRYHGLLVAATDPPAGRSVLLSKLEETLVVAGVRYDLSVNRYPGALHPRGDRLLESFSPEPYPTWTYEAAGVRLRKTLFVVHGETTAVVSWEALNAPPGPLLLEVRPLVALRDHHALRREERGWDAGTTSGDGVVTVRPVAGLPPLRLFHDAASVRLDGVWYRSFELDRERERGFDFVEDLFSPATLTFDLAAAPTATVVATTGERRAAEAASLRRREEERRKEVAGEPGSPRLLRALRSAADRFLVRRGEGWTVIAGYPWFTDWGRDTMISLPGLALATGRLEVARSVLSTFARFVDRGMVPNRFPDHGEPPEYNTVDGTLWFVEAARAYLAASGDEAFAAELYPLLLEVVEEHLRGTRFGIRADDDGLLLAGEPGVQLTWMDAKVGDHVVTPRHGKPVEVQALWHNALRSVAALARDLGDGWQQRRLTALADRAAAAFSALFWSPARGHLVDVVGRDGSTDPSLRPNQLLALSLPYPLVEGERAESVLAAVERHLLTPFGLRTLAPSDPAYRGRYEGGPEARDGAYHQGTVWPWLMGPLVDAHLAVRGDSPETRWRAAVWLRPLCEHLLGPGLGELPEVYDGDPPQRATGCVAQAWSVAEVLRAVLRLGLARGGEA